MGAGGGGTQTSQTKSQTGKHKLQEELTGFDVEGHSVSAEVIRGVTESRDVRGDLETDHALNALARFFLCRRFQDLAQRHTV